jgi:hypothetical protein
VYSAVVLLVKIPVARTFSESEKPAYWPVPPVKATVPVALSSGTTLKSMDEVATPNTSSPFEVEVIVNVVSTPGCDNVSSTPVPISVLGPCRLFDPEPLRRSFPCVQEGGFVHVKLAVMWYTP